VVGYCEDGSELSVSIKTRKFLDQQIGYQLSIINSPCCGSLNRGHEENLVSTLIKVVFFFP
jgi:hypothetical protein